MRIMITGAGGLVGQALASLLRVTDIVVELSHGQLEISDPAAVRALVQLHRPALIINCAVIGVDLCEERPDLARRVNIYGPATLAEAADSIGAAMVHFSSNYVFDGSRTDSGFYTIQDLASPINEYGRTKLLGEQEVTGRCEQSWIVRTSWVFGPGKDSFLATAHRRLAAGEQVTAINDTFASTTWVEDLAARVNEIIRLKNYGTFHVVNSGVCSYASFAAGALRILGLSEELRNRIQTQSEAEMKRPAPRPRWTPMACELSKQYGLGPMRDWREALAEYIGSDRE